MQLKTHRPVQFEITEQTRSAVEAWIRHAKLRSENFLFPSRLAHSEHVWNAGGSFGLPTTIKQICRLLGLVPRGFSMTDDVARKARLPLATEVVHPITA